MPNLQRESICSGFPKQDGKAFADDMFASRQPSKRLNENTFTSKVVDKRIIETEQITRNSLWLRVETAACVQ